MQLPLDAVQGFIAGDIQSFKTIYELTKQALYGLVYRMVGNREEAEDVLHDVYVRAFEKRETYKAEKATLYTWLYRLTVNYVLNVVRARRTWHTETTIAEIIDEDLLQQVADAEDEALVMHVLDKVAPDFKICLLLREVEGKAYDEIALLLDVPIGTVRSRINRGRAQLKELFVKNGGVL